MTVSFDIQARADGLERQLSEDASYEKTRAVADYWIALVLMVVALISSVLAGLGGLAFGWDAKLTGVVALVPGAVAVVAATMKFESKSDWHYRKLYKLSSLKSRLLYEMPLEPSVDHIAGISKERRELIEGMEKEWETGLSLSWNQFRSHRNTETQHSD